MICLARAASPADRRRPRRRDLPRSGYLAGITLAFCDSDGRGGEGVGKGYPAICGLGRRHVANYVSEISEISRRKIRGRPHHRVVEREFGADSEVLRLLVWRTE